jgi:hypothetical protein
MALSTFQQLLILLLLLGLLLLLLLKVVPSLPLSLWLLIWLLVVVLLLLLLLLTVCRCQTSLLLQRTTCAPVFEKQSTRCSDHNNNKNAFTKQPALYSSLDSHPLEPTQCVHESLIYNATLSRRIKGEKVETYKTVEFHVCLISKMTST